jgi:hypothetical protein
LSMKYYVLSLLLVFIITAGLSLAKSPDNNTSKIVENKTASLSMEKPTVNLGNNSSNVANASAPAVPKSNASETAKAASEIAKMKGIWSITGIKKEEQITMALQQDGGDLFGQAKYEPQAGAAWNAVAIGSVNGDTVALVVTSLEGKEQVSEWLNGTFANDAFSGKFFEVSKGTISLRGDFSATLVNPEITDYTQATVTAPAVTQSTAAQGTPNASATSTTTQVAAVNTTATQKPATVGGRPKFVDVREYKDKIGMGGDLSGVPPGMG